MNKLIDLIYALDFGTAAGTALSREAAAVPKPGILVLLGLAGIVIAISAILKRRHK